MTVDRYTIPPMSASYRENLIAALVFMENLTCDDCDVPPEHVAAIRGLRQELEGTKPDMKF